MDVQAYFHPMNRTAMPTTTTTSDKAPQHYRPAAEFDDATLAKKREYWKTKKREQRAKLSEKRGKPKPATNSRVNNAPVVLNSSASHTIAVPGPPLLNIDGSYQMGAGQVSLKGEDIASQHQKEKWFQRIKLNKVFPQFPGSDPGPAEGPGVIPATGGAVGRSVTSAKLNGVPPNSSPSSVPQVRVTVHPSGSVPRQLQSGTTSLNGSSPAGSTHRNLATQATSEPILLNKAFRIQPMAQTGTNMVNSHMATIPIHKPGVRGANVTRQVGKRSALATPPRRRGVNNTLNPEETEEERSARMREQWRLKKREQRAKEKSQKAAMPSQNVVGQMTNVVLERPPSVLNRVRARTPLTTAGRLLKNARAVAAFGAVPRPMSVTFKKEASDSQPLSSAELNTVQLNANQSVQIKVEDSPEAKTTIHAPITPTPVGYRRASGESSGQVGGHTQFTNVSRGYIYPASMRQRSVESPRSFMGQRNMRGRFPSLSAAFTIHSPPKENPFETPEQRASRRREYWRVKKREQRAKLTVEVKTKMKEKDALMRRVKRYQGILEEMRRARSQPIAVTHTNASETIGGFIKEDGTVTIPHMTSNLASADQQIGGRSFSFGAHQLSPGSSGNRNMMLGNHIRVNPPPPPLRPAQVKVSCPPIAQSVTKQQPPRLLSIRPRADLQTPHKNITQPYPHGVVVRPTSQITLSHPQNVRTTFPSASLIGAKPASCVMQMAVTSSKPIPLPQKPVPELTEEERMAKKREYWRVKKREQRAARATRQKQGPAHGRGNAAFQKRRNQKAMSNRRAVVTKPNVNIAVRPKLNIQVLPDPSEIKQEILSASPNDLNCESGLPLIMDIKIPPLSPPVPQETQPEPDPALSAETQATTLLAVASMKKLLEESLSTVTETESQQTNTSCEQLPCKIEAETCPPEEEDSKQDMKPQLPLLSLEGEEEKVGEEKVGHEVEVASMAADQPLEVTGWQKVAEALPTCQVAIGPLSPDLKVLPLSSELSSLPACTQTLSPPGPALPPSEPPPHTASCTHGTNAGAALPTNTDARSSERLRVKKIRQQHCCSPQPNEPGKLHHPPLLQQQSQPAPQPRTQPQPQPRPRPQPRPQPKPQPAPEPVHQPHTFGPEKNMTLERKREYWKIMKRQQRARSKARQRGESFKQGDYSRRLALKVAQSPNLCIMKTQKPVAPTALQASPPPLLPKPSAPILQPISAPISGAHASLTAVANIPTVLVVSPTMATLGQPPDTLQVKPPISSAPRSPQQVGLNAGTLQNSPGFSGASLPATGAGKEARLLLVENKQEVAPGSSPDSPRVRKWSLQVQDVVDHDDIAPIPTLTPPANPLASIKLLPIQPSPPFRLPPMARPNANSTPYGSAQSGDKRSRVPQWFPTSTLGPPKPIPGESEEETLRRKREYWRVKKKEQRARKAMGDKRPPVANWAPPILPPQASVQGLDTQDLGQWVNAEDGSGLLLNSSSETELDYSNVDYTAPIEDEADIIYPDGGENMDDCEISEAVWRHRYLMDHDPLNQLLVCMVCGDLQYTHSLEGVRAHIEEAHPETLALEAPERRRILDAWDEQVSQRERFFTSQLQQHGGPLAGDSSNLPAEVVVDTEET